ncbi:MAG: hypothetical protein HDR49_00550 [Bacteroides sp.]|nr:hypothetical protein [Bacteroides sp.]
MPDNYTPAVETARDNGSREINHDLFVGGDTRIAGDLLVIGDLLIKGSTKEEAENTPTQGTSTLETPAIRLADLDTFGTDGSGAAILRFIRESPHTHFRVVIDDPTYGTLPVGCLDVMTDNTLCKITQVLTTRYTFQDGSIVGHSDDEVYIYHRAYGITKKPLQAWTDWQPLLKTTPETTLTPSAPDTIRLADLDTFGTDGQLSSMLDFAQNCPSRLRVIVETTSYGTLPVGCLDVIMDNTRCQITQILTTHLQPIDGIIDDHCGHTDHQIRTYVRFYDIPGGNGGPPYLLWSKWQQHT